MPDYTHHLKPEPHQNLQDVEVDDLLGWRYTYRNLGMTRNAKPENMKRYKVFLDPIPHVINSSFVPLRGWYKNKVEDGRTRARPCDTEALLTQPYGGTCSVGCRFCYVNSGVRGFRGSGVTTVDPEYPEKVVKQLGKMRTGAAGYLSSFIEPFNPLEPFYHNTQRTAEAFVHAGLPIFFLTRMHVPDWAYDLLLANPHSYTQFSISTSSEEDWKRLSPGACSLEHHYEQIRELSQRGVYISIQVNPIIPGITSQEDIVELIHRLAEAGARHAIFKFIEISYPVVPAVLRNLRSLGASRVDAFKHLFVQNIGGTKSVTEEYRKAALDHFSIACRKAGLTMSTCYEYEYARDARGKVIDKTGVNMGPKYLTGDQCHGQRVPVYSRATTEEPFKPIDACAPSGCLYCVEAHADTGEVPCGNSLLANATALRPRDLLAPALIEEDDLLC